MHIGQPLLTVILFSLFTSLRYLGLLYHVLFQQSFVSSNRSTLDEQQYIAIDCSLTKISSHDIHLLRQIHYNNDNNDYGTSSPFHR